MRWVIIALLCLFLLPSVAAESELGFLNKANDIVNDLGTVMDDLADTLDDYTEGLINDAVFVSKLNEYHDELISLESRANDLEIPCWEYNDTKDYLVKTISSMKWAVDDLLEWYETGDDSQLDLAIFWLEMAEHWAGRYDFETMQLDPPVCEGDGEDIDFRLLASVICLPIAAILIILGVLSYRKERLEKKRVEEMKAKGICLECEGLGQVLSEYGWQPCETCGGTGKTTPTE